MKKGPTDNIDISIFPPFLGPKTMGEGGGDVIKYVAAGGKKLSFSEYKPLKLYLEHRRQILFSSLLHTDSHRVPATTSFIYNLNISEIFDKKKYVSHNNGGRKTEDKLFFLITVIKIGEKINFSSIVPYKRGRFIQRHFRVIHHSLDF